MFQITANLYRFDGRYQHIKQIPTFFLDPNVQGILTDDHAVDTARRILDPFDDYGQALSITAVKL